MKTMKSSNCCGYDGISYNMVSHGGDNMVNHICNLFNLIFEHGILPDKFNTSIVCPYH